MGEWLINQAQELEPFLVSMPFPAQTEHLAVGTIEGCERRRRPNSVVTMGPRLTMSAFQRQAGLSAIQGLHFSSHLDSAPERAPVG